MGERETATASAAYRLGMTERRRMETWRWKYQSRGRKEILIISKIDHILSRLNEQHLAGVKLNENT